MIDGITLEAGAEGVAVLAARRLIAVSSALVGGGVTAADAILNVHVPKGATVAEGEAALLAFARRAGVGPAYIGLLTSAATEKAEAATAAHGPLTALAVATVGLSNRITAGASPASPAASHATINVIVVVDGAAEPAALVNAVMTVTEVKTLALIEAGVQAQAGRPATGTSTDAVVIAVTGSGRRERFGGPVSEFGWVIARAADTALRRGIARWVAERV